MDRETARNAKPLSAEEVVEQLNIYADIAGTEHEEFYIRAALATIDRQAAQLAVAVKALEWLADNDPVCPHTPRLTFNDDVNRYASCAQRVASEALAAIEPETPLSCEHCHCELPTRPRGPMLCDSCSGITTI